MVGFVSPEVWGEWGWKCRLEWWEPGGMTEDPGRVNVRREGAEEERDGTGVEGRVRGRRRRQVIREEAGVLGGGHGRSCFRAHVRWEPRLHGGEEGQTSSSLGPGGMGDADRMEKDGGGRG